MADLEAAREESSSGKLQLEGSQKVASDARAAADAAEAELAKAQSQLQVRRWN